MGYYRRDKRHRIDWQKEIEKTERARRKGLKFYFITFVLVLMFILVVKRTNPEVDISSPLKVIVALIFGVLFMMVIGRFKDKLKK